MTEHDRALCEGEGFRAFLRSSLTGVLREYVGGQGRGGGRGRRATAEVRRMVRCAGGVGKHGGQDTYAHAGRMCITGLSGCLQAGFVWLSLTHGLELLRLVAGSWKTPGHGSGASA